jgi:glycerophosphoryl diester phosphodiesterase
VHSFDHPSWRAPHNPRSGAASRNSLRRVSGGRRAVDARRPALDVWPQWELIDDALVERVHGAGGRVIAWTVNSTDAAERLLALGVDGLCGDDVRLFPQRA